MTFQRFAGSVAMAVGLGGIGYSIAFLVFLYRGSEAADTLTALFLLVGGLLTTAVLVAVYERLRETDAAFALWGFLLGTSGALGSAIHGGWELALIAKTPEGKVFDLAANPVDPRGLMTFGVTALGLLVVSWLIVRGGRFPKGLGYLGFVTAALLLVVYFGRLLIFNPKNPGLLAAAVATGFILSPAWFIWLGSSLRAGTGTSGTMSGGMDAPSRPGA